MPEFKNGLKCKAVCDDCGKSVSATFKNETISLCEGLEEIENVLVVVCNECSGICSIPYKSLEPIQNASERLIKSKTVSGYGEITLELKSQVDKKKAGERQSESDFQHEHPMQATG